VSLIDLSLHCSAEFSFGLYLLANNVSVLRCVEHERVIRIAGIDEISAAGGQQFLDLVDCLVSDVAWLALIEVFLEGGVIANRVHEHGIYILSVSVQVIASAVAQPP
jgi:hypothetical protein